MLARIEVRPAATSRARRGDSSAFLSEGRLPAQAWRREARATMNPAASPISASRAVPGAALLGLIVVLFTSLVATANEPFLRPNDVIALVGGEDMVVASELGYLELLLTRALPDHKLKFRCLAWEGDTVFEQRRDLNYPTLEQQLDKIGATVVIAQFGQMESLAGKEKLPEFVAAYEKLIGRLKGGGKRRVLLLEPRQFESLSQYGDEYFPTPVAKERLAPRRAIAQHLDAHKESSAAYALAVRETGTRHVIRCLWFPSTTLVYRLPAAIPVTRDGLHAERFAHEDQAENVAAALCGWKQDTRPRVADDMFPEPHEPLRSIIIAKNRLWHHYYRPQNWAFLAGDRTNQPSSRDHIDRNKRWFPEELEQFLPLIEAKEREIWELAAKLAQP